MKKSRWWLSLSSRKFGFSLSLQILCSKGIRDITNRRVVRKSYGTTSVLRHIITTILHVVGNQDLDWPLRLSANGILCSP